MHRRNGILSALVSAAFFGTMAIIVRLMYERGAEPLQVLTWRFLLAATLLAGYTALSQPGVLRVTRVDLSRLATLSVFGYAAASLCFFFALGFAEASVVAILLYTYPALIVAYETFSGTPLTFSRVMALLFTFAGCVLVVDPFAGTLGVELPGLVLGLGAGVGYASFTILGDRLVSRLPKMVVMTYLFAFAGGLAVAVAVGSGARLSVNGWSGQLWWLLAALVIVPTFGAVLLYFRALQSLGPAYAAILSTFEPVFTLALAVAILGEKLAAVQWAGAVLVLAGVVIAERAGRRARVVTVV